MACRPWPQTTPGRCSTPTCTTTWKPGTASSDGPERLCPDWRALLLKHPTRFLIGSDTWINPRWQAYASTMQGYRAWLGELPPEVARAIGWGNGARLFGLASDL